MSRVKRPAPGSQNKRSSTPARLWLVAITAEGHSTHPLPETGTWTIGRDERCDLSIEDSSISREHAKIFLGETLDIEDRGSSNGTRIAYLEEGDETAKIVERALVPFERTTIRPGARIRVGSVYLNLEVRPLGPTLLELSPHVVAPSPVMQELFELVVRVAKNPINILLSGETGVGKEIVARELHRLSNRNAGPFLAINCAALSETLVESEIFGHERGAFTGALATKLGLFERGHGGTVFLDEIAELSLNMQAKLLRVLEERVLTRVGGSEPHAFDVRIIAASNRDLSAAVGQKTFREDLFFRLKGMGVCIPPLRDRREDILPLARRFAELAALAVDKPVPALAADAVLALESHSWPGNVRELRNAVERAIAMQTACEPLTAALLGLSSQAPRNEAEGGRLWKAQVGDLERQRMIDALEACGGNRTKAAAKIGMPRRTFMSKLAKLGMSAPPRKS